MRGTWLVAEAKTTSSHVVYSDTLHRNVGCKLLSYELQLEISQGGGRYGPLLAKHEERDRELGVGLGITFRVMV